MTVARSTAVHPATKPSPARPVAPAAVAARTSRPESAPVLKRVPLFVDDVQDDEFRLDVSDLPRRPTGMHVDGLQPSLTSRVFDLFDRLRGGR